MAVSTPRTSARMRAPQPVAEKTPMISITPTMTRIQPASMTAVIVAASGLSRAMMPPTSAISPAMRRSTQLFMMWTFVPFVLS